MACSKKAFIMNHYGKNQKWLLAFIESLPYQISKISVRLQDLTAVTAEDYYVFNKKKSNSFYGDIRLDRQDRNDLHIRHFLMHKNV
jgi:hypothetical protein